MRILHTPAYVDRYPIMTSTKLEGSYRSFDAVNLPKFQWQTPTPQRMPASGYRGGSPSVQTRGFPGVPIEA